MPDITPNSVMALAKCYQCASPAPQAMRIALMVMAVNEINPMADTSPNALMRLGACYGGCVGATPADTMELGLLTLVLSSVGGLVQVFSGNYGGGAPTAVPTTSAAIAYDLDAPNNQWLWNGTNWF